MSLDDNPNCVIIDNGTQTIKTGFSGDEMPRKCIPNICGGERVNGTMPGMVQYGHRWVGEEALAYKAMLRIFYPVKHGHIVDWHNMQKIWHHILYNELCIFPADHSLLLTEVPLSTKCAREKSAEIMFETFNVNGYYSTTSQSLSLYSYGLNTGIVIDSGYDQTNIVPIYGGHIIPNGVIERTDISGKQITNKLTQLLIDKIHKLNEKEIMEITNKIKEEICFIKMDDNFYRMLLNGYLRTYVNNFDKYIFPKDVTPIFMKYSNKPSIEYELPDGEKILIADQRWECCDILGYELSKDIFKITNKYDTEIQKDLLKNVVFSGGNTMFDGIENRVKSDFNNVSKNSRCLNIVGDDKSKSYRKYSAFIGASMMTSLSVFDNMLIKKHEYDEYGARYVHKKCVF
eukprot:324510_1